MLRTRRRGPLLHFTSRALQSLALVVLPLGLCVAAGWLHAANGPDRLPESERLVREALHREIYGLQEQRDALLEEAAEADPTNAATMWHRGFVRVNHDWVPLNEIASRWTGNRNWTRYLSQRGEASDTVADQLRLANWCRDQKLVDQERAHLNRVVQLDPNHATARQRLGFRLMDGIWVTDGELEEAQADARQLVRNLQEWRPRMVELQQQLASRSLKKREAAEQSVLALADTAAIPAMEDVLSTGSEEAALLVVAALERMPELEASVSLARHAVFSPSAQVRAQAAQALKSRNPREYAPVMLASMYTPVQTYVEVGTTPAGRLVYRHRFLREGQDERQLLELDTEYERMSVRNGDRMETLGRAVRDAQGRARQREQQVSRQNLQTQQLNTRLAEALRVATGQNLPANPQDWWEWWYDTNDIYVSGDKPLRTVRDIDQVYVADSAQFSNGGGSMAGGRAGGGGRSYECLAAGTPVFTQNGPQAIETIQVGDMVLSQHPETGELTLKAVLQTTVRPEGPVVRIVAEGTEIDASSGHLFWSPGEGWVVAKNLQSGMLLHTAAGTVRISRVEEQKPVTTYNLIVEDFHTYFAGETRVLCHDNSTPQPTNAVVPGLK